MRRRLAIVIVVGMALVSQAQAMRPGLWEITTQMSGGGMPAMPAISDSDRKQMAAMGIKLPDGVGGAMSFAVKHCVTKEQAEKRQPPQTEEDHRQHCEQKDVKVSGNTVTWTIECSGEQKMTGTGSMTYQGEESYAGEATLKMQDVKHGQTTLKQKIMGKWLAAACK